jgi:hypothetical protein
MEDPNKWDTLSGREMVEELAGALASMIEAIDNHGWADVVDSGDTWGRAKAVLALARSWLADNK